MPDCHVAVVGEHGCGKTKLVDTFRSAVGLGTQEERMVNDYALSYSYFDAVDPDDKDDRDATSPKISVWSLSDDVDNLQNKNLLDFVIRPEYLEHQLLMIALDLSKPWDLMKTLEKWSACLEEFVKKAMDTLSVGEQDALKGATLEHVKTYKEPQTSDEQDENANAAATTQEASPVDAPLPTGLLTTNIGLPIVVVCCKADVMQTQEREEKDASAIDRRFEFIQQRLRSFCLKYGAALVYTAAATGSNCVLLQKYLLHRLYPTQFPQFQYKAQVVERDTIFVPSGWDGMDLIGAPPAPWDHNTEFEEVIQKPKSLQATSDSSPAVSHKVDDEQDWLQGLLKKQKEYREGGGGVSAYSSDRSSASAKPSLASTPTSAGASNPKTPTAARTPAVGAKDGAALPQQADLQNFFSNLLSRGDKKKGNTERDKAVRENAQKALGAMQSGR
jgi:dynein light intermediate chain 1